MIKPQKVLIIQTAFLGDVVLATSLIEKIRSTFPGTQIDFLLRKGNESLLAGHPYLNKVHVWDKQHSKYSNLLKLIRSVRNEEYDVVINCQRFFSSGLITAFSGAPFKTGFSQNPLSFLFHRKVEHKVTWKSGEKYLHETERYDSLIAPIAPGKTQLPRLYPTAADRSKVEPLATGTPFITVSPSSVWFTKQLPLKKWIEFVNSVNCRVLLLGAKSDWDLCELIRNSCAGKDVTNLAGELSLLQSAALMTHAKMNYTNDSAPLHLASAMNAPVCAVFCSTIPEFGFGPLSSTSHTIQVKIKPPCLSCGLHGKSSCPLGHFKCSEIDVEDLTAAIK